MVKWVECPPVVWETRVQSQIASYQRLKKWYLIPPCLTLSNIRYVSRVKWSNPEEGEMPSPTPRCSSYWKGSFLVTLDYDRQLYFYFTHIKANKKKITKVGFFKKKRKNDKEIIITTSIFHPVIFLLWLIIWIIVLT